MAKRATNSDDVTLKLIQQVDEQRQIVKNLKKSISNRTNMTFSYSEVLNGSINLNTVSKVDELIKIASFLISKKETYESAAKLMQVENVPEFKWMGFVVEDWVHDIKNKIDRIQLSVKEARLNALEQRLEGVISPELKRQRELESIAAELNQ
jgi:cysteinyl-tRNA synthetase